MDYHYDDDDDDYDENEQQCGGYSGDANGNSGGAQLFTFSHHFN